MIRVQDVVVFQGSGDERSALGPSISHPVLRLQPWQNGLKSMNRIFLFDFAAIPTGSLIFDTYLEVADELGIQYATNRGC